MPTMTTKTRKPRLPIHIQNKIRAAYNSGESVRSLAIKYDRNVSTINRFVLGQNSKEIKKVAREVVAVNAKVNKLSPTQQTVLASQVSKLEQIVEITETGTIELNRLLAAKLAKITDVDDIGYRDVNLAQQTLSKAHDMTQAKAVEDEDNKKPLTAIRLVPIQEVIE